MWMWMWINLLLFSLFAPLINGSDAVTVSPSDGSIIALPSNIQSSDLPIELNIAVDDDPSKCHPSTLQVFANGDQTPTLLLPIDNLCNATAVFTLKNLHFGTLSIFFQIESLWKGFVYYDVVPKSIHQTIHHHRVDNQSSRSLPPLLPAPRKNKLSIVVVGTNQMDGQKMIWYMQMVRLIHLVDFTYICYVCPTPPANDPNSFIHKLRQHQLHVNVILFDGFHIDATLALHAHFPNNVLSLLHPSHVPPYTQSESRFIDQFHRMFVNPLRGKSILVFANSQSSNDLFLLRAAQIANVAVVFDLPNLYPNAQLDFNLIDIVVSPSQFAQNHFLQHSSWFLQRKESANDKVVVISPGVDVALFQPLAPSSTSAPTYRIAFVGRLAPEKSPGLYLRTLQILETYHALQNTTIPLQFVVVGNGILMESMKIVATRLGIATNITYMGWLNRSELSFALQSFDVVINPSLRESETFCIANIEAMAAGVPVVSLGAHGVGEYLNKQTNGTVGLVIGHHVPRSEWCFELAMLAYQVLTNASLRATLQTNARRVAMQLYSADRMVSLYYNVYQKLATAAVSSGGSGGSGGNGGNGGQLSWKRRAQPISVSRVLMEMAKSEVNKLSLDVKEAEQFLKAAVHHEDVNDPFSNFIRGAVLGITRFPIVAHLPNATWYALNITVAQLQDMVVLNESSWWRVYGVCPSIEEAAATFGRVTGGDGEVDEHTARIKKIKSVVGAVSKVVVAVSTNFETRLTLLDGNHRAIVFLESLGPDEPLTLLLGLSEEFGARDWKGSFYCT